MKAHIFQGPCLRIYGAALLAVLIVQSALSQSAWIALDSPAGEPYVGHQLECFDQDDDGSLSTKEPAWISLYRTEGQPFFLRGEVYLGGLYLDMLFAEDLPDGFGLWIREWSSVQRYQFDSRRMIAKRTLIHGRVAEGIELLFYLQDEPELKQWIPFELRASKDLVEFAFGSQYHVVEGPLATHGANKIAIAPGTRLRNLELQLPAEALSGAPIDLPTEVQAHDQAIGDSTATEPAPLVTLNNGDFEAFNQSGPSGVFGEPMFSPGSTALTGWSVSGGSVGLRERRAAPGGFALELGPRDVPGCISQTISTISGRHYRISLDACTGRAQFHFNRKARIRVGDLDTAFDCPIGSEFQRLTFEFTATSPQTKLTFCAGGSEGFGPLIDNVHVSEAGGSTRNEGISAQPK